jgi:Trypsin-like peptidase domain
LPKFHKQPPFDLISLTSYYLESRFESTTLSTATGFFATKGKKTFLITNWHVVSGRNPETKKCLSDTGGIPDNLLVRVHGNLEVLNFANLNVDLLGADGNHLWIEHPTFGGAVDVVALQVKLPPEVRVYCIQDFIEPYNEDTEEVVSEEVFVIGYPFGASPAQQFPVWKRASIATEPLVDVDGLPKMLVDTATRSGMSGSPVLLRRHRGFALVPAGAPLVYGPGTQGSLNRMKVIGIYSGRIGVDDEDIKAQLGVIWKRRVLDELLAQVEDDINGVLPAA